MLSPFLERHRSFERCLAMPLQYPKAKGKEIEDFGGAGSQSNLGADIGASPPKSCGAHLDLQPSVVRLLSIILEQITDHNSVLGGLSASMRGLNFKPSRVYQTASLLLESKSISQPPPWFSTIGSIPPSEILTRTQPTQHRVPNSKSRTRKPSKMFKPQPIEYEEDRLRKEFYGDHPWELARPRIVLENDGKDGQRCDWSRIQQPGRPLNGERYGTTGQILLYGSNVSAVSSKGSFGS
jgi:hypothetical protein